MQKEWWLAGGAVVAGIGAVMAFRPVEPKSQPFTLPTTKREFTAHVLNALSSELPSLSIQTKALIIAHAAFESGWGKTTAAQKGANLFNITAGTAWTGPVILGGDTEYDAAGNVKKITQKFRLYHSLGAGLRDYMSFLGLSRYAAAKAQLLAGDAAFAATLGPAGYYTLPVAEYWKSYSGVLRSVVSDAQALLGTSFTKPKNYIA